MINFLFLAGTQFFLFRAITGNYPSNNAWTNHGLSMFKTNIFFNFGVSFFYIFLPKIFWRRKVSWECTPECSKLSWRFSRLPGGSAALVGQWQERIKLSCQRLNRRFQRKQETSLTVSFSHRKRTVAQKCHDNSILLTAICSRQFQFTHGNFNFTHGNFNLFTAISVHSRQFQLYLLTASSIYSRQFQLVHGNFNLPLAISIFWRQITLTAFFAWLITSKGKIKSRYLKSIFKLKSENQKSKIDSRTLMPVDSE